MFSRTRLGLYFLPSEVDEYSYSFTDIVLNMIKILFLKNFEVFSGFVYLFAINKHQSVQGLIICLSAEFSIISINR